MWRIGCCKRDIAGFTVAHKQCVQNPLTSVNKTLRGILEELLVYGSLMELRIVVRERTIFYGRVSGRDG